MKTLKNSLKQENVNSINIKTIFTNYSKRDCVRIALYCAEDCFCISPIKEAKLCIDLIKKWLEDEESVTKKALEFAVNSLSDVRACGIGACGIGAISYATICAVFDYSVFHYANCAIFDATIAFGFESEAKQESKSEEYRNYARLFAYEDLDFPHKDFSKTFNLDDNNDLNVFLDFLTDNYPDAITYPREEYFKTKLAKEYLKVIYQ